MNKLRAIIAITIIATLLQFSTGLAAETKQDSEVQLDVITVTAQKQEENAQDVPIGVTVLDSIALEDREIDNTSSLADQIPNLMLYEQSTGFVVPSMRGIASTPEGLTSPVGMYIDGVPLLSPNGLQADLIDIERVEVLRGPQSTLYGKGAEVGVINIITQKPGNEIKGRASIGGAGFLSGEGSDQLSKKLTVSFSGPISKDKLFFGISGMGEQQNGFMRNEYDDTVLDDYNNRNLKGQLRWTPFQGLEASLILTHIKKDGDGNRMNFSQYGADYFNGLLGGGVLQDPKYRIVNSDYKDPRHTWKANTAALKLAYTINDNFALQSVTTRWVDQRVDKGDYDFNPIHLMHSSSTFDIDRISEELRLNITADRLKGVVGAYLDRETFTIDSQTTSAINPAFESETNSKISGISASLFANMTYQMFDKWSVVGGLRWGRDVREYESYLDGATDKKGWNEISPRLSLQYQMTPEVMLYTTLSKGFRPGNYAATSSTSYNPETIWNYEFGVKSMLFDNRLMLNANVYYMNIDDMQVREQISPALTEYTNAAKAIGKGFELEWLGHITNELSLDGSFGYSSVTYDQFSDVNGDYAGNQNLYTPEYTFNTGLQYRNTNGFFVRGEVVGYGKMYFDKANKFARDPYALVNGKIGYETEHVEVYLYGKNIFDKRHDNVGDYNGMYTFYSDPGQLGLQATFRF